MLTINLEYEDFDGQTKTKELSFNMTKRDLVMLQGSKKGGIESFYEEALKNEDTEAILGFFEDYIKRAYGEKVTSEDGTIRFAKSTKISEAFSQTAAYAELIFKLMSDEEFQTKFMNGVLPKEIDRAQLAAAQKAEMEKLLAKSENK